MSNNRDIVVILTIDVRKLWKQSTNNQLQVNFKSQVIIPDPSEAFNFELSSE